MHVRSFRQRKDHDMRYAQRLCHDQVISKTSCLSFLSKADAAKGFSKLLHLLRMQVSGFLTYLEPTSGTGLHDLSHIPNKLICTPRHLS